MIDMKNLTGQIFGRLTVISFSHREANRYYWLCKCVCGVEKLVQVANLKSGSTKSCGCNMTKANLRHGFRYSRLYIIYEGMMARCYNDKYPNYRNWGGRGITVCDDWKNDRTTFFNWALTRGYDKDLQLDRRDNELGYSPENCRFVSRKQNCRNKKNNLLITYGGETRSLAEWCDLLNIKYRITQQRITKLKWDAERAFYNLKTMAK